MGGPHSSVPTRVRAVREPPGLGLSVGGGVCAGGCQTFPELKYSPGARWGGGSSCGGLLVGTLPLKPPVQVCSHGEGV